jgi:hypothetical protein
MRPEAQPKAGLRVHRKTHPTERIRLSQNDSGPMTINGLAVVEEGQLRARVFSQRIKLPTTGSFS